MAQHQVQRITVERTDVDFIGEQRLDHPSRREQWSDALAIESGAALPIIRQQMMPKCVIAGMGILDGGAEATAESILQRTKLRIGPHHPAAHAPARLLEQVPRPVAAAVLPTYREIRT